MSRKENRLRVFEEDTWDSREEIQEDGEN